VYAEQRRLEGHEATIPRTCKADGVPHRRGNSGEQPSKARAAGDII